MVAIEAQPMAMPKLYELSSEYFGEKKEYRARLSSDWIVLWAAMHINWPVEALMKKLTLRAYLLSIIFVFFFSYTCPINSLGSSLRVEFTRVEATTTGKLDIILV